MRLPKIIAVFILCLPIVPLFADSFTKIDANTLQCNGIAENFCRGSRSNSIWQITFCNDQGKEICRVSGDDAAVRNYKKAGSRQILFFDRIPVNGKADQLSVTVTITSGKEPGKEFWQISWKKRTPLHVQKVKFPVLTQVVQPGEADVMFPIGNYGGRLYKKNKTDQTNIYPSFTGFVQLASFTIGGKTLAVFPRDPAGLVKTFSLLPDQSYSIETVVPLNSSSLPFDIEFAVLDGNYLSAAKEYRAWAIRTAPWMKKGPLHSRTDLPREFFHAGPWFCMGWMAPETMDNMVKRAEAACGMPISLHWYVWHKETYDTHYPELNPQPGFEKAVKAMQKRGNFIVPYINGHLWDQKLKSYSSAKKFAVLQRNGSRAIEKWGTPKRPFSVMCPGTDFYQKYLTDYAGNLIRNANLHGLYIDQISAVIPAWCYEKTHQHAPGPGSYWRDGYAKLLGSLKTETKNQAALFSECAQEIHYDNITGNLCWIPVETEDVPLLPAIYSGYTTYFGSPASKNDSFRSFAVIQQRALLWGIQPGWSQAWLISKKQFAEYLGTVGKLRLKLLTYLTFGEYLGDLPLQKIPVQEDTLHYTGPSGTVRKIQTPATQTAIWKNQKGNLLFLLANATGLTQTVREEIKCPAGKHTIKVDGIADNVAHGDNFSLCLTLKPYEIRYVELVPFQKQADNPKYAFFASLLQYGIIVEEQIGSLSKTESAKHQIHWKVRNITKQPRSITVNGPSLNIPAAGETEIRQIVSNPVIVQVGTKKLTLELTPRVIPELELLIENEKIVESGSPIPLTVNLKNNTDKPVPIQVKLVLHKSWKLPKGSSMELVAPPGLSRIRIPATAPDITNRKQFSGRLTLLRNGKNILSERLVYQVIPAPLKCKATFFNSKPNIDGILNEFKSCPEIVLTPTENGKISAAVFSGKQDCSAIVRLGYDKNCLYFSAEVTDNIHYQPGSGDSLWKGDCIQIALLGQRNRRGGVTGEEKDFVLALTDYGSELYDFQTKKNFGTCFIVHKNGKTLYEAAIPWKHFGITPASDSDMAISFVISDNDGTNSMKGYLELTPGIFGTKDSSVYRILKLKP